MKIEVVADVDADCAGANPIDLKVGDLEVRCGIDDQGRFKRITVRRPIANYEEYLARLVPGDGTRENPHRIEGGARNPVVDELIDLLQYLESLGGFWLQIRKIHWNTAEVGWVAQSEDEERKLHIKRERYSETYRPRMVPLRDDLVLKMLANRTAYQNLTLPMAFLREGQNDYRSHRYATAYANFYFVLEDMYGRGKTKNAQVERAFKESRELRAAVQAALARVSDEDHISHRMKLEEFMKSESCSWSVDGAIRLLVRVRGNLFHFSQKSTKNKATPLNQREFHSIAYLILAICMNCTVAKLVAADKMSVA